jgi:metal-responsive CopG/Arc/MetJ family transcriptional regulator
MTGKKKVINMAFDKEDVDKMDQYKATGFIVSRSHLIRIAVREYMQRNPVDKIGKLEA